MAIAFEAVLVEAIAAVVEAVAVEVVVVAVEAVPDLFVG